MRGKTLVSLLDDLRAEARLSLNPAHNAQVRETHVAVLQRVQEWLWHDFDWPHLRVERFIDSQANQRFYDLASAFDVNNAASDDLSLDKIEKIEVRYGNSWAELVPEIGPLQYRQFDPLLGQTSWPITRWRIWEGEQIEIWPVPAVNADATSLEGRLKVTGIRNLKPLVADSDRADLDSNLIVLFAASELLVTSNQALAKLKLDAANKLYAMTRSALTPRRRFRMFGETLEKRKLLRGPPSIYYRTTS